MPIYEYICWGCNERQEIIRKYEQRNRAVYCQFCKGKAELVASVPQLGIWNAERRFPNVSNLGDGSMTFPSKDAYERHLKANHMAESAIDGKVKTPHGAKVTVFK